MTGGTRTIVVGDCGGTNTRLALWEVELSAPLPERGHRAPGRLVFEKKYLNEKFQSFVEVMGIFLEESCSERPSAACLACAGPIVDNTVTFTNIASGWEIIGQQLEESLNIKKVKLLNDFEAMGYGLLTLNDSECHVLHDVPGTEGGVIACAGAGTGLGECFLTKDPASPTYVCWPSEGGHTDVAPRTDLEVELLNFLRQKFNHRHRVSHERIISGIGLSNVYEFLCWRCPEKVKKEVQDKWTAAGSLKGAVVAQNAEHDELCHQAMEIMFNCFASECGNVCLKYLPTGGFFIAGGIAAKNLDWLTKKTSFLEILMDKGRVSPALKKVPVKVVLTEDCGERGAHLVGCMLLKSLQ